MEMKIKLFKGELRKPLCAVFLTLVGDNLFVKSPGLIAFKLSILSKDSQTQNQAKFFCKLLYLYTHIDVIGSVMKNAKNQDPVLFYSISFKPSTGDSSSLPVYCSHV
jgi:hypothetical protein